MESEGEVRITAAAAKAWLENHVCTPRSWIMPGRAETETQKSDDQGVVRSREM